MSCGTCTRPIRLALLGCGRATRMHGRTLRRFRSEVRCYYASRDLERARRYWRAFGGAGFFHGYDAALGADEVDAVLVATPPALHLDLTLRALRAGKHVIVEKPAFLRATDFDVVLRAMRESGRQVMVAENYFYKPLAATLRRLLASGAIGDVRFVFVNALKEQRASGWRADPVLSGGGALFEGGIHWIDLIASLGLPVVSVRGFGARPRSGLEQGMLVVFEFAGGAVGTLAYSWEVPSPLKGLRLSRIHGSGGSIVFESNGLFVLVCGRRKRLVVPDLTDVAGRRAMLRAFLRGLRTGQEPELTLDRARRDLELVEAAYGSLRREIGVTPEVPA